MNNRQIIENPSKEDEVKDDSVVILTGKDGVWKASMEGMITPRDLSRIIRTLKIEFRLHIRKFKNKGN